MDRRTFCKYGPHLLAFALAAATTLMPQSLIAQVSHPWTVSEIWGSSSSLTGNPPEGMSWSPNGARATWIGKKGSLLEIEPPNMHPKTLIPAAKIAKLLDAHISNRASDHRARYGEPDYIWSPDSQHLLFDTNGELWLFDINGGDGVQIGNSGMQSGDDPKFSPSGNYISYIRNHNLYVQPATTSGQPMALTSSRRDTILNGEVDWVYLEELNVRSNYFWSPDSTKIAYLQMNETHVPTYPLVNYTLVHPTVHEQRYPQPGDPNPGVRVGVVGVHGGPTHWLKIPISVGNDYIPRFGWVNSHVVWVETLSRDQKHEDLWFADTNSGLIRRVLAQTEAKYFNTTYGVTFAGNNTFFVLSWRDGHTHIYRYTYNPENPLGGEAQLMNEVESGDYEVKAITSVNDAQQTLWYVAFNGATGQQQVWAVKFDGSDKRQITHRPGFHVADFSAHTGDFIDQYSAELTPPSVSACTSAGECTTFWHSKPIRGHRIIPPDQLVLTAADGSTKLYGTIVLPPGRRAMHSVPLIVNPYGGPDVGAQRDEWGGKSFLFDQLMAQHGFAVLHVDNRGMGGRGRAFEQVCYHNFGPPQFADQMTSVDQVLRRYPELDPHRLGWWGWSWGGSFTLFAMSHSSSFLAGVAVAPVTDWRDYDSIYTERYMGLPSEDADNYREDSDVTSAANLHGHILIMHGTGDDNVHMSNTIQYINRLIQARIPYDLNVFPRKTHSIAGPNDRTILFSKMLNYFERYVMNPSTSGPERSRYNGRRR